MIFTDRLRLINHNDCEFRDRFDLFLSPMVEYLKDKTVVKFSEQRHIYHTLTSQIKYIHSFGMTGTTNSNLWVIVTKSERFIGTVSSHEDVFNRVANMGIMIGETSYWGKGYGTEAWSAVMEWLFENGTRKVEAGLMRCNAGMWAICKKTGMEWEAAIPRHFIFDGEEVDMDLYGKFAP